MTFLGDEGEEIIRVAVVDDQKLFARGLSGLVELLPGVEVVGVAYNGEEAIALCRKEEPESYWRSVGNSGSFGGRSLLVKSTQSRADVRNRNGKRRNNSRRPENYK